jgi:hypothetical protein
MRQWRQCDFDPIACSDDPAFANDRHDPGFADHLTSRSTVEHRGEQAGLEALNLTTRVAQACHLQDHVVPNPQQGTPWQCEQIDIGCCDVLTQVSRLHAEALRLQLTEQLGMDQVYLPEVRLAWIDGDTRPVLDGASLVRVSSDAEARDQLNLVNKLLRKTMRAVTCDCYDASAVRLRVR